MSHDQHPTPEQDAELARQALAQGDLAHAIHHIGSALVSDPTKPDWLSILNEIIGKSPDPLGLVPIADGVNFVTAATRAWVQASIGNYADALSLIGNVAKTRPDVPFLTWAEWWMGREGVVRELGFDSFMGAVGAPIMRLAFECPSPMDDDDRRKPNVQSGLRIFQRARAAFPTQTVVFYGESICCRRLGMFAEALPLAQHALALEPSWRNCVAVAQVYRDTGDIDSAIGMFRQALEHDPTDLSAHLDIGDMLIGAERYDEARAAYQTVLASEAEHPWATASLVYLDYVATGDGAHKVALLELRDGDPRNGRAADLLERIDPPKPYVTWLPRAADASANAMRSIFERMYDNPAEHHGSTIRLRLSHPESPSIVAAFWLQMEMWGPQVNLVYETENVQQPDPRVAKAQTEFQLWAWQNGQPVPLAPRPDQGILREVYELCELPFHLTDTWGPKAAELGQRLGPNAVHSLLGMMVHPPRPPNSDYRVLMWVQRVQVACAMVLAHIDQGWQGSLRQRALYSLVYGPVDWTVDAGVIALGYLARTDAAIRADVDQVFRYLQGQIPREGFTCYEYPLAATWLHMGGHDDATRQWLEQWIERILNNETTSGSQVHSLEMGPKPFDQAAEMQKAQAAQAELQAGGGGDPDPTVFPGQPVPRLSDYVRLMKGMQTGDMMGALGQYGLDMTSYGSIAAAWGQKLASDPGLNARFSQMMQA